MALVLGGHPGLGGLLDQLLADLVDPGVERTDRAGALRTGLGLLAELGPELLERLHGFQPSVLRPGSLLVVVVQVRAAQGRGARLWQRHCGVTRTQRCACLGRDHCNISRARDTKRWRLRARTRQGDVDDSTSAGRPGGMPAATRRTAPCRGTTGCSPRASGRPRCRPGSGLRGSPRGGSPARRPGAAPASPGSVPPGERNQWCGRRRRSQPGVAGRCR